jgi:FtsP/CotA-like multicopper oxidase with cupredoxin domain
LAISQQLRGNIKRNPDQSYACDPSDVGTVEDYIGDFVLHCHILDHKDHGDAEHTVAVPDGIGGVNEGHH